MAENINVDPDEELVNTYSPCPLVEVPELVPFNKIFTPGSGSPLAAVTLPERFKSWAVDVKGTKRPHSKANNAGSNCFFIKWSGDIRINYYC